MNRVKRQRILELALAAPNVDNAQPFYFRWEGEHLLVFRDGERDRRRGNVENYVSMVGLGCLAEYIVIAASGEKLAAALDFRYGAQRTDGPWLAVAFASDPAGPDELLPGLEPRCSDRRAYRGGELSEPVFRRVAADAARFPACRLYFQAPSEGRLLDYMLRCEGFLWEDEHILPEMLSWVRWSREQVRRTRDGMPWQAMGVSFLTSRLMQLVARSRLVRRLARRSGGPLRAMRKNLEEQVLSSAALGCIAVRDTRHETMFQLGRLFVRAWVRLNMAGFGVQVMANPAIHAFQHAAGILPADYPAASQQTFARGRRVLAEAFGVGEGEIPAWMFRTGRSGPLPAEMRTLRLPLSQVLQPGTARSKSRQPT